MVDGLDEAHDRFKIMCGMHEEPLKLGSAPKGIVRLCGLKRKRATIPEAVALEVLSRHHGNPAKLQALVETADRIRRQGIMFGLSQQQRACKHGEGLGVRVYAALFRWSRKVDRATARCEHARPRIGVVSCSG